MAVAAAALPLLAEGGKAAMQLAQTPVIGWERVETTLKGGRRPRSVVQRTSVQVRAWELGVLAGVGLIGLAILSYKPSQRDIFNWHSLLPFPANLL